MIYTLVIVGSFLLQVPADSTLIAVYGRVPVLSDWQKSAAAAASWSQ